jgi:hypothetical protein
MIENYGAMFEYPQSVGQNYYNKDHLSAKRSSWLWRLLKKSLYENPSQSKNLQHSKLPLLPLQSAHCNLIRQESYPSHLK